MQSPGWQQTSLAAGRMGTAAAIVLAVSWSAISAADPQDGAPIGLGLSMVVGLLLTLAACITYLVAGIERRTASRAKRGEVRSRL